MKKKHNLAYKFLYRMNLVWVNVAVAAVLIALTAVTFFEAGKPGLFVLCIVLLALLLALDVALIAVRRKKAKKDAERLGFSDENGTVCTGLLDAMQLATVILTQTGKLCWANIEFKQMCEALSVKPGAVVSDIFENYIKNAVDEGVRSDSKDVKIGKGFFKMYFTYVRASEELLNGDKTGCCVYFVETTAYERLKDLYKRRKIVLGEILVDNYEEIFQTNGESVANQVLIEVNNIFNAWIQDRNAIIKRLTRERYIMVVEEQSLKAIEAERFTVLESVKKISVGNSFPVTLSIGLSTNRQELTDEAFDAFVTGDYESDAYKRAFSDTLAGSFADVDELLNLSLSRGGDQAIVKTGADSRSNLFFGGSEIDTDREDMVSARVNAGILKDEILKSKKVLCMGHAAADLDAIGSALAVYRISMQLGVRAYVVLDGPNPQISVVYAAIMDTGEYGDVFISKSEALNILDENTLTVVTDTFSERQVEAPEVVHNSSRIIVIDHHRRGVDFIKNTIFNYADTMASSASELIVEMIRYIFPNEKILRKIEAETLYGGILLDTKNMFFKTSRRTFDVCAYLRQQGVIPVAVRKYIQPSFEDYKRINEIVSGMKFLSVNNKGVALTTCTLPRSDVNKLASMAADKMLEIAGVDCSFVIVKQDSDVAIKARSLGDVNVQIILEHHEIAGGGHFTAAAGYVKNCTPERAEQLIVGILRSENKPADSQNRQNQPE